MAVLVDFPCHVKGLTVQCDGHSTIMLNAKYNFEQNLATYVHEKEHIQADDFNSTLPATEIEKVRHGDNEED